jgi:hypothetical protein
VLRAGKPPEHPLHHADLYLGHARSRRPLLLSAVDPATPQPGERPLHHPTPLDHPNALAPRRPALDRDHVPAVLGDPSLPLLVVVLVVPQSVFRRGNASWVSVASTCGAAVPSSAAALVTVTARSRPSVSTTRCRFRPSRRGPPSEPGGPPSAVAWTVGLSMLPALGVGSRPPCCRTGGRKASWIACRKSGRGEGGARGSPTGRRSSRWDRVGFSSPFYVRIRTMEQTVKPPRRERRPRGHVLATHRERGQEWSSPRAATGRTHDTGQQNPDRTREEHAAGRSRRRIVRPTRAWDRGTEPRGRRVVPTSAKTLAATSRALRPMPSRKEESHRKCRPTPAARHHLAAVRRPWAHRMPTTTASNPSARRPCSGSAKRAIPTTHSGDKLQVNTIVALRCGGDG